MKKFDIWVMTITCVVFVQTCKKAFLKVKRMDEQKKEWRSISSNETGEVDIHFE